MARTIYLNAACAENAAKGYGGTYVTDEDIKAIAAYINEKCGNLCKKILQYVRKPALYLARGKNGLLHILER